jgi:hypothetical protein
VADAPLRVFDLLAAVEYVRGLGATGVTISTIRGEIASGRIPHMKLGKNFYVAKIALDAWITRAERRRP